MRLAIPIWNGRVSPVFDTAAQMLVIEVAQARERDRREEPLAESLPAWRVRRLVELNVEVLICGAISRPLATMLAGAGIRVVPWTAGPVEEILTAYLAGKLPHPQWMMPGCACRQGGPGGSRPWRRRRAR
jgi:predicted Fe-Mo cluster-binding NifX family protein